MFAQGETTIYSHIDILSRPLSCWAWIYSNLFVLHIQQMLHWTEIWGIGGQDNTSNSLLSHFCFVAHYPAQRGHSFRGDTVSWKGVHGLQWCLRRWCVKVTSTCIAGPKVSQQNIAQSITLPPLACLLPIVHPGARSVAGGLRPHPDDVFSKTHTYCIVLANRPYRSWKCSAWKHTFLKTGLRVENSENVFMWMANPRTFQNDDAIAPSRDVP